MSNEDPTGGQGTRRAPRQGVGGSPVGSTLSIVLAVVAVVAGFLILRNITDDNESGTGGAIDVGSGADATTTTSDVVGTTVPATTTTVFTPVTEGATVVVANANTVGGSAGRMTKTLETAGFTMGEPTNATDTRDESIVYYDPSVAAAQAVAESVGVVMGGLVVEPVPTPPPTNDGTMGDGSVLVRLGNNQADKTLEELRPEAEQTPATGTAPDPSGGDATTDTTAGATADTTG